MDGKHKYDPNIHHRRSIRLKGYDYSQAGEYYITICIKDKACLLGRVANGEMILNDAGRMIDKWWQKIPEKFPGIELDECQIMPNHFHAIITNVGADPSVRPVSSREDNMGINVGADPSTRPVSSREDNTGDVSTALPMGLGEHTGSPLLQMGLGEHTGSPLRKIIQWFKTMATNEYIRNVKTNNWEPFNGKVFQRDYYEHIIRNDKAYNNIVAYIRNNPANWESDMFYSGSIY